jgi:hypothetical protein
MRSVFMYKNGDYFYTEYYDNGVLKWKVEGRTLDTLEIVVDWLESAILPKHSSR